MVVTKDATITVASANVTLITIGYFFVCLFVLICFFSGFAAKHIKEIHAGNGEISLFWMNNSAP